jgi:hypothetical protein
MSVSARRAFAAAAAAVLAAAALPWSDGPLRQLAGEGESGRGPDFDVPLDRDGLLIAALVLPRDALYFTSAPGGSALQQGNLKAAAQLYLADALPVQDPARAQFVLVLRGREVLFEPR